MFSDSGQIGCLGVKTPFCALAHCKRSSGVEPKKCEVWDLFILNGIYLIRGDLVLDVALNLVWTPSSLADCRFCWRGPQAVFERIFDVPLMLVRKFNCPFRVFL